MCEAIAAQGFITFCYAVLFPKRKRLLYCNAGHNPPILAGRDGVRRLDRGGGVLGVFDHWTYEEDEVSLHSGDRILMYTDGISESRNPTGEEFGEWRLIELVRHFARDAAGLTEAVIDAAAQFNAGNFDDDLTLVGVSID